MPGNHNKGKDYSIPEQVRFANFMACQIDAVHTPFSVNSDTKFYDREHNRWIPEMAPVLDALLRPDCGE